MGFRYPPSPRELLHNSRRARVATVTTDHSHGFRIIRANFPQLPRGVLSTFQWNFPCKTRSYSTNVNQWLRNLCPRSCVTCVAHGRAEFDNRVVNVTLWCGIHGWRFGENSTLCAVTNSSCQEAILDGECLPLTCTDNL
jgi:hypothetical protein